MPCSWKKHGRGGGSLNDRFNVSLGGMVPRQYDPYLAQARQQLLQPTPSLQMNSLNPMGINPLGKNIIDTMSAMTGAYQNQAPGVF